MHARSALFDLYGDHLLARGGWAPISAVVGLLGTLDISAPAVRTAVSRVVRECWLEPVERDVRGYAATAQARERLAQAHARIYRTETLGWDGHWHVVSVERLADRNARARLAQSLGYLGYGQLAADTWVAPRESPELPAVLERAGVGCHAFRSQHQGQARAADGRATLPIPEALLAAMEQGLPNCTGVALGFARLVMLAVGAQAISDVVAF